MNDDNRPRKLSLLDKTIETKHTLLIDEKERPLEDADRFYESYYYNNPLYKSQIGLVYMKPRVDYSVTLYFHAKENTLVNTPPKTKDSR